MAKLHEVLSVEKSLFDVSKKLIKESSHTFTKSSLFMGGSRQLTMFDENAQNANTREEQELTTTVDENLAWVNEAIAKYWDAVGQKDITNTTAVADIIVRGKTIAANVPATFLLGLETKLKEVRKLYEDIPTLRPGVAWEEYEDLGENIFRIKTPVETVKTEKVLKPVVLYEATKEHPAQVKETNEVIPVGKYVQTEWSGMLRPVDKADRLKRIDDLLLAVKKARQRANEAQVVDFHIGETLFNFINKGSL